MATEQKQSDHFKDFAPEPVDPVEAEAAGGAEVVVQEAAPHVVWGSSTSSS